MNRRLFSIFFKLAFLFALASCGKDTSISNKASVAPATPPSASRMFGGQGLDTLSSEGGPDVTL